MMSRSRVSEKFILSAPLANSTTFWASVGIDFWKCWKQMESMMDSTGSI